MSFFSWKLRGYWFWCRVPVPVQDGWVQQGASLWHCDALQSNLLRWGNQIYVTHWPRRYAARYSSFLDTLQGYQLSGCYIANWDYWVIIGSIYSISVADFLAVTSSARNSPWFLFLWRVMMMLPPIINSYNLISFHQNSMKLVLN